MKRRKFSNARSRTEIVSTHRYGSAAPAPAAVTPPAPAGGSTEQECPSCSAMNDLDALFCDQCGAAFEETEETAVVTPPPAGDNAPPVADPENEDGIDNGAVCQNGDCGHLASEHVNTDAGDNMGACQVDGCSCQGMEVEADPNPGSTPNDEGGVAAAGVVPVDVPPTTAPPQESASPDTTNAPPEMEGGDSMGPQFTIPVAIIEGQETGDGRQIATGALEWRTPPLPLMGLATETHDPEGWDLNDPAVICGRIDSFERVAGEGSTQVIMARGYYLPNEDGMYFAELNEAMGRMGVSADVAVHASEIVIGEIDEDGWPTDMSEVLTEGTIMGLTVCPYPAFEGAYIMLGDGTGNEAPEAEAIPQQAEAPEVPSVPPASVTAGGQLIHFMSYEECEPCNQGLDVVVASGGPTRPPMAWFSNPNFTPGDERLVEILDRRGDRAVGGKYACPLTVTDEGRVFGHIAPWDVCHTGVSGSCIIAPRSSADYAHFKRGQHLITAEGEPVRVGVLTLDVGHASTSPGVSPSAAMAHYDNTALAVADVNIGEDEHGIWVAGAMRPDATEEHARKLRAASISGDWRNIGGRLELVAALAVNQPGFPLAVVAGGHVETLVAAGASMMQHLKSPVQHEEGTRDEALRAAFAPMLDDARMRARNRLAILRA